MRRRCSHSGNNRDGGQEADAGNCADGPRARDTSAQRFDPALKFSDAPFQGGQFLQAVHAGSQSFQRTDAPPDVSKCQPRS